MKSVDHGFPSIGLAALHLVTMYLIAVAHPLLQILSEPDHSPFFTAHNAQPADIYLLVLGLCFGVPLLILVLLAIIKLASSAIANWSFLLVLVCLFYFPVSQLVLKLEDSNESLTTLIALAVAFGCGWLYARAYWMRMFVTALAPAIIAVPFLFLTTAPVRSFIDPPESAAQELKASNLPNIVMIVFDEFPVYSIMNEGLNIDASRFPNFASLASDSTWFRNTAAMHFGTFHAAPPILIGSELSSYLERHDLKSVEGALDRRRLPFNIFTLFEQTHEIVALERLTRLAPAPPQTDEYQAAFRVSKPAAEESGGLLVSYARYYLGQRFQKLWWDSLIIGGHALLPHSFRQGLPDYYGRWEGFAASSHDRGDAGNRDIQLNQHPKISEFIEFSSSIRRSEWPVFYFAHFPLPHFPYEFDEQGNELFIDPFSIPDDRFREATGQNNWPDESTAILVYQAHLLQVTFLDRLLGLITDRLKELDLYDRSLVVVTSDHGTSFFWASGDLSTDQVARIQAGETLFVPLFIKAPFQEIPVISDVPLQTADILPTIADLLGVEVPWEGGGVSAFALDSGPRRRSAHIRKNARNPFTWSGPLDPGHLALKRKTALFGTGNVAALYASGQHSNILGTEVADHSVGDAVNLSGIVYQPRTFDARPGLLRNQFVEGTFTVVHANQAEPINSVAVAVNGVIRSTAPLFCNEGNDCHFKARIPFQEGRNDIGVFGISESPGEQAVQLVRF